MAFMTPPIGINRGYLFGVGQEPYKDHVYVAQSQYPFDPFTNPKLCKAFDQSSVVVSEFQDTSSHEQELNEFFQTLPERLEKALKPEDLLTLKNTLAPLLDQIPSLKTCQGYDKLKAFIDRGKNDAAAITILALFGMLNILKSNRNRVAELSSGQPSLDDVMIQALSS